MLRPRIIPCLLVHKGGLVKTIGFNKSRYIGDPINAVRIFNEKEVDELILLDIDATVNCSEPDYRMISNIAAECRMPLCYGGGIKTPEQAKKIISLGVEKIAISSAAIEHPDLITMISNEIGNQSVAIALDVKRKLIGNDYELLTHNGKKKTNLNLFNFIEKNAKIGFGDSARDGRPASGAPPVALPPGASGPRSSIFSARPRRRPPAPGSHRQSRAISVLRDCAVRRSGSCRGRSAC